MPSTQAPSVSSERVMPCGAKAPIPDARVERGFGKATLLPPRSPTSLKSASRTAVVPRLGSSIMNPSLQHRELEDRQGAKQRQQHHRERRGVRGIPEAEADLEDV